MACKIISLNVRILSLFCFPLYFVFLIDVPGVQKAFHLLKRRMDWNTCIPVLLSMA